MPKPPKKPINEYLRYTGLGFELLACILIGVGAGYWLDQHFLTEKPWFTLFLSLLGCVAAIFLMIRRLGK
jgi:F0F1-type ATP synthase assembly protein I